MTAAQDSRAQFEAWAESEGLPTGRMGLVANDEYSHEATQIAWLSWQASRAALSAELDGNCQRCKGSGEDPEGFLDQSRGPDGDTHDGPCRECGGSGAAAPQPAALKRTPTPASRDCTRPECMSHGCFGHCMQKVPTP